MNDGIYHALYFFVPAAGFDVYDFPNTLKYMKGVTYEAGQYNTGEAFLNISSKARLDDRRLRPIENAVKKAAVNIFLTYSNHDSAVLTYHYFLCFKIRLTDIGSKPSVGKLVGRLTEIGLEHGIITKMIFRRGYLTVVFNSLKPIETSVRDLLKAELADHQKDLVFEYPR